MAKPVLAFRRAIISSRGVARLVSGRLNKISVLTRRADSPEAPEPAAVVNDNRHTAHCGCHHELQNEALRLRPQKEEAIAGEQALAQQRHSLAVVGRQLVQQSSRRRGAWREDVDRLLDVREGKNAGINKSRKCWTINDIPAQIQAFQISSISFTHNLIFR